MDKISSKIASVVGELSSEAKTSCDILNSNITAFKKSLDIGKIIDVTFAPDLTNALSAFDKMEVSPPHRVETYG